MTEPRSPFEDVPLVRVAPSSDARRIQVGTLVVLVALVVLIIKPWGEPVAQRGPAPTTAAIPSAIAALTPRPTRTSRPDGARQYDPALFGRFTVVPRWELWPTLYVYQFGLMGPMSIDGGSAPGAEPTPIPTATPKPPRGPASPPPGAGQLIDIGSTDLLMVLGLDTPADTRVLDARLWRFPVGGAPVQMALQELPPPWPVNYFHVYGLRAAADDEPDLVAAWTPGVYRLDLLVDPGAQIRRIGLLVRPPLGTGPPAEPEAPAEPSTPPTDGLDPTLLAPNMITFGTQGGAWVRHDLPDSARCGLADLWLAERDRPNGPCWSIVVSQASVAAVDLGPGRTIEKLAVEEIDPVQKAIGVVDVTDRLRLPESAGSPRSALSGRIIETADRQPLAEGTYRLVASLADGTDRGWYFRVAPHGG
jgi:hypothetical protein